VIYIVDSSDRDRIPDSKEAFGTSTVFILIFTIILWFAVLIYEVCAFY
jgi:hypothetical protein